jgi:hypothetical protein
MQEGAITRFLLPLGMSPRNVNACGLSADPTDESASRVPQVVSTQSEVIRVDPDPDLDPNLSWQPESQLSDTSQAARYSTCTPEVSMFARSLLEPSSMAGGPSALPSTYSEGEIMYPACMLELHGAVESEMASMHGDPSELADALSESAIAAVGTEQTQCMHRVQVANASLHEEGEIQRGVSMHSVMPRVTGRSCVLGGMHGGPSALSDMHGGPSALSGMHGGPSALSGMHGGPSDAGASMGYSNFLMPFAGTAAHTHGEPWCVLHPL